MSRGRAGFTFAELAVALVLFGILSSALVLGLSKQNDFRRTAERESVAQILGRNEIEMLRGAGPSNAESYVGSRTVDSAGNEVQGGTYLLEVAADTICVGGASIDEDQNTTITSGCNNQRNAILRYSIEISYRAGIGRDTLEFQIDLSERGRFGNTRSD